MTLLLAIAPVTEQSVGDAVVDLLPVLVSVLLSGGLITALVAIYTARKKVPHERDSIIVSGAETAVLALERTLQAETRRADREQARAERAEALVVTRDTQIDELKDRLDQLQASLDEARESLNAIVQS